MEPIEEEIIKLGRASNLKSLKKLISDTDEEELIKLVKSRVVSGSFLQTWNYILKGLSMSTNFNDKRLNIIKETLKALENREVPSSQVNDIVNYISGELPKYDTQSLVSLYEFCLEGLQNNEYCQFSWKELFPQIMHVLSEQETIHHNGSEMTGKEFKSQVLNTLCMLQWAPDRVTAITSMFIDMPLTKDEHTQVVNKLGTYIEKLTPQEIPGFIHQLLKLCKDQNCKLVFMKLQNYFGVRIYETSSIISYSSSESADLDAIESATNQDLIEAESTVLYHIHSLATLSSNSIKEYLTHLRNMTKAPELILHPFQLTILLTVSTIQHYEKKIFDILKSCITRFYKEHGEKETSSWFREMVPKVTDIEKIFNQVLTLSFQDRDTVLQGLMKFAFVLLNIKSGLPVIFLTPICEKEWHLAMMILLKIIRHKRHKSGIIIQEIIHNVLTDQNVTQYIECLYLIGRKLTLILFENQSCMIELMEDLSQIPGGTSIQLLDAIMPLVKVSSTIRDHLILLLRKALYSSKTDARQMAVMGYINLLTSLKISDSISLSQMNSMSSFSSGHSLFTQLSLNRSSQCSQNSFSNEALCLEILSILKRCFIQKFEVRNQLYDGLYSAVCMNVDIRIPVLNILWLHFSNYYVVEEETLPPLDFSKISITKDIEVIQQEPLGKLLHIIGLIVTQNDDFSEIVQKFKMALDSTCERMMNCELIHFELDDGTDLSDILPECRRKVYVLQEAMRIYEALIGYKINSWCNDSTRNGAQIVSLFQAYNRFLHFSKNIGKSKKDRKKKNDTNVTQQTNNTTVKKAQKNSPTFKVPDTILDFQTVTKALQLLLEPVVEWTTMQEAGVVRSRKEIHRFFLQSTLHLVTQLKGKRFTNSEESKENFKNVTDIAGLLYKTTIKTLSTFIDFDCTSAVLVAECFYTIINYIYTSHKKNSTLFFEKIVGKEIGALGDVVKVYQTLFELDDELEGEDTEIKKLLCTIINTLSLLSNLMPSETTTVSIEFHDWLKNYAKDQILRSKTTAAPFFTLLFSMENKFDKGVSLFDDVTKSIAAILGTNIETDASQGETYKVINELTVDNAFLCLTNSIKALLDEIDWVIYRSKSEVVITLYVDDANNFRRRESLHLKEKGITYQLHFISTVLCQLTTINFQPGPLTEAFFKVLSQFYSILTSFTKYFNSRSSKTNPAFQKARFEKLVRTVGRELSPNVNRFITYLEEESKNSQSTQNRKKSSSSSTLKNKILKDTRSIPKVVYGMEQFSSSIIQLSNKTKIDLSKHIGQGIARDFRIFVQKLAIPLDSSSATPGSSRSESRIDESDAETVQEDDEESLASGEQGSDDDDEEAAPPQKKSRKS